MGFNEWVSEYWWILAIIVVVIMLIVYNRSDAYTKSKFRKVFSGRTLFMILFLGGWFLWHKYGGQVQLSEANRWMPIFGALFLVAYNYIGKLRYETGNQLITPNFHGSYSQNPKYVDGFYIFAIDSFNSGGISWHYAKRIAVIREETLELFNEGALSIANMGFASKYELPENVQKFIENNKFFKGATQEVYYGWFDDIDQVDFNFQQLKRLEEIKKSKTKGIYTLLKEELGVRNPSVKELFWLYKNQSKSLGKQTEFYDATVESVEKGVEHAKRVKDAYVDKSDEPQQKSDGYEEGY